MTPDEMRAKAKELWEDATKRLKDAALGANVEIQIAVTVDHTASLLLGIFADVLETLNPDVKAQRAKEIMAAFAARNDALRKSAAKGFKNNDWSEFDRLVDDAANAGDDSTAGKTG